MLLKTCLGCQKDLPKESFYTRHRFCKSCFNVSRKRIAICRRCKDPYSPGKKGRGRYCSDKCRFMDKVLIDQSGCWLWQGHCQKSRGYGTFVLSGWKKSGLAHRASYLIFKGELKENDCVIHSCDRVNCVAPQHLSAGSHLENMRDMINKGRDKFRSHGKIDENKVKEIRKLSEEGHTKVDIAKKYNVSWQCIYEIVKRKTWYHV